jgi:hypothetical protein
VGCDSGVRCHCGWEVCFVCSSCVYSCVTVIWQRTAPAPSRLKLSLDTCMVHVL